jgi:hypothetical protein
LKPLSSRPRQESFTSTTTSTSYPTSESLDDMQVATTSSHDDVTIRDASISARPLRKPPAPDFLIRRSNSVTAPSPASSSVDRTTLERPLPRRERRLTTPPTAQPQTPAASFTRWKFLSSFLSLNSTHSASSTDPPAVSASLPQKGEVVCLSYTTLDDRGMRRLEGRSDHRPVIGSYVIYL